MDGELIRSLMLARKALIDAHQQALAEIERQILAALEGPVSTPPPPVAPSMAPDPQPPPVVSPPLPPEPLENLRFRTYGDFLVHYIATHDGLIDFYEISRHLYGSDSERNRMRVTRLLYSLQQRMRIKRLDPVKPLFKVIE